MTLLERSTHILKLAPTPLNKAHIQKAWTSTEVAYPRTEPIANYARQQHQSENPCATAMFDERKTWSHSLFPQIIVRNPTTFRYTKSGLRVSGATTQSRWSQTLSIQTSQTSHWLRFGSSLNLCPLWIRTSGRKCINGKNKIVTCCLWEFAQEKWSYCPEIFHLVSSSHLKRLDWTPVQCLCAPVHLIYLFLSLFPVVFDIYMSIVRSINVQKKNNCHGSRDPNDERLKISVWNDFWTRSYRMYTENTEGAITWADPDFQQVLHKSCRSSSQQWQDLQCPWPCRWSCIIHTICMPKITW